MNLEKAADSISRMLPKWQLLLSATSSFFFYISNTHDIEMFLFFDVLSYDVLRTSLKVLLSKFLLIIRRKIHTKT